MDWRCGLSSRGPALLKILQLHPFSGTPVLTSATHHIHGHSLSRPVTHPWTRTVWECSVPQPGGPWGGSMETERPRLPWAEAGMDTSVTVWGRWEPGESGRICSMTGVTTVW
jgi:hypothetical protein